MQSLITKLIGEDKSVTKKTKENGFIWQDRHIRFDIHLGEMATIPGEQLIDTMANVEDTKGENKSGSMLITNLRVIWFDDEKKQINLSIGYNCIISHEIKEVVSPFKGGMN